MLPISASLAVDLANSHPVANVSPHALPTLSRPDLLARLAMVTVRLAQVPNSTSARGVQPVVQCSRTDDVYLRVP